MKEINVYIGKRIKEYREKNKLTQEYMAKELDIATNHYGRIERGENSCTLENLVQICNLIKATPNDLIGALIITPDNNFSIQFDKLNIEDKATVKKIMEFLLAQYR